MNVIQEITSQTSAGTTATAKSIGKLAELANQLRNSVAGFKLPELMNMDEQEEGLPGASGCRGPMAKKAGTDR